MKYTTLFSITVLHSCLGASSLQAQTPRYKDVSAQLPSTATNSQTMDVVAADLDKDGDLDLILANEFQRNRILFNDGAGIFADSSFGRLTNIGNDSEDIGVADFNRDGWPDIVFVSEDNSTHELYYSTGGGGFTDVSTKLPLSVSNAVLATDLNGDTHPDLVLGNAGQDLFLINDGKGDFIDETSTRFPVDQDVTQDVKAVDIDKDGDLDLVFGNEDQNKLYINNDTGMFTDETLTRMPQGMNLETRKIDVGDYDSDGDPDLFLSNVSFILKKDPQDRIYQNDGTGIFTDVTATTYPIDENHTIDGIFADLDGDSDLDIITTSFPQAPYLCFLNTNNVFEEKTSQILPALPAANGLGVIHQDLNGDGLKDLYFANRGQKDRMLLQIASSSVASEQYQALPKLSCFPNPAQRNLAIKFTDMADKITGYRIYDIYGKQMTGEQLAVGVGVQSIEIPIDNLPAGAYTVTFESATQTVSANFIKS